jgi:type I restriction enzyme S subunit
MLPRFLAAVLDTPRLQMLMRDASGSTAQPHLYLGDLRALPIPVPPVEVQERVIADIDRAMEGATSGETRLTQARTASAHLGTAVLRDAFSGALVHSASSSESAETLVQQARNEVAEIRTQLRSSRRNRRAVPAGR